MKKTIIIVVVVALVAYLVYNKYSRDKKIAAETGGAKGGFAAVTEGFIVKTGPMDNVIQATGTLVGGQEVELRPELSGKVISVPFKEGSYVKKGDLILKINDADLAAQLKRIKLQIELAEKNEDRQAQLLKIQGVSQQEYDAVLNQLNTLKAEKELLEAQIAKTEVRAPFSGRVGLKSIYEGAYVSPTTLITTIIESDPLKIDFSVPERYANKIRVGDRLSFRVEGSSKQYEGRVYALNSSLNLSTRTLTVRGECPNPNGELFPGNFALIQLTLEKENNAILIPSQAVIPKLKGQEVYIYRGGKAVPVDIMTGYRSDTSVQVSAGLNEGDTVIISGIMQIRPNSSVKLDRVN